MAAAEGGFLSTVVTADLTMSQSSNQSPLLRRRKLESLTQNEALGRYHSPESMLQDPDWVSSELEDGHQVPADCG